MKSSSDVVGALMKELRLQTADPDLKGFRVVVAVDGINALWGRTTLKKEDKSPVETSSFVSPSSGDRGGLLVLVSA